MIWEYKQLETAPSDTVLNEQGRQGWELVGITQHRSAGRRRFRGRLRVTTISYTLYFKRLKPDPPGTMAEIFGPEFYLC